MRLKVWSAALGLFAGLLVVHLYGGEPGAVVSGRVTMPKGRAGVAVVNKRYEVVTKEGVTSISPPLAVVYLEGSFSAAAKPGTSRVVQKELAFWPALLPVQTGTRVEFPNEDDTYHNVFSYSPAKRFDLGRYRAEERPIPFETFDTPGLVTLRCDIHEHMHGLILVVDTPYFVVTAADGQYKLDGLPEGSYTLKAWLNSRTTLAQKVELKRGQPAQADFAE